MFWVNLIFVCAALFGLYRMFITFRREGGFFKSLGRFPQRFITASLIGLWFLFWLGAFIPDGDGDTLLMKVYGAYKYQKAANNSLGVAYVVSNKPFYEQPDTTADISPITFELTDKEKDEPEESGDYFTLGTKIKVLAYGSKVETINEQTGRWCNVLVDEQPCFMFGGWIIPEQEMVNTAESFFRALPNNIDEIAKLTNAEKEGLKRHFGNYEIMDLLSFKVLEAKTLGFSGPMAGVGKAVVYTQEKTDVLWFSDFRKIECENPDRLVEFVEVYFVREPKGHLKISMLVDGDILDKVRNASEPPLEIDKVVDTTCICLEKYDQKLFRKYASKNKVSKPIIPVPTSLSDLWHNTWQGKPK